MTKQETFNFVKAKLLAQKVISAHDGQCKYRQNGKAGCTIRCAAGHLIPDAEYDPIMEGGTIGGKSDASTIVTACIQREGHDVELVKALQLVHDDMDPEDWPAALKEVAEGFGLKP